MELKEAIRRSEQWGDKICNHPKIEREINIGFSTGDYVCSKCGQDVGRDEWEEKRHQNKSE